MKFESAAFAPLAHATAIRKVVGLGIGKLPRLLPIARERALIARAGLSGASRQAKDETWKPDAATPATEDWRYQSKLAVPGELLDLISERRGLYAQDVRQDDTIVTDIRHAVVSIPEATMYTNGVTHRSVFDGADNLSSDFSSFRGTPPQSGRLALPSRRRVTGRTFNAFGTLAMAGGNYSHWLVDGVAMLFSMERFHDRSEDDHVIVPPMFHDFHSQSLELLGFQPDKVIELHPLDVLSFDELVCSTPPRGRGSAIQPGWANKAYRDLLIVKDSPFPTRKIYVSRRDAPSRNFVNELEVSRHLEASGFETVELSSFDLAGKAQLFAEARCIVSLSGAGLANAMFCSSACTVVEIQPPRLLSYNIGAICSDVGCNYDFFLANDESVMSRYNPYYGELHLDVKAFSAVLERHGLT